MTTAHPLKWHGGKSYLASWLHSLAPPSCAVDPVHGYTHRNITHFGAGGEFWGWQPVEGISETVNDLNSELMNFWAVLRSPEWFADFHRLAYMTPFSESVWRAAAGEGTYAIMSRGCVSQAWRFFVRYRQSRQGLGKDFATPTKRVRREMNENVSAWLSAVEGLPEAHARLSRVELSMQDAVLFVRRLDHARAFFYCDPPYKHSTRSSKGEYGQFELSDEQHEAFLHELSQIKGQFMLSGYRSPMYDRYAELFSWRRVDREIDNKAAAGETKPKRIESVWMNY